MRYDYKAAYEKNAAFLHKKKGLRLAFLLFNRYASYFFALAYGVLLLAVAFDEGYSPKNLALLLCLPACTLLAVSALRIWLSRPRPYEENGAGITPLLEKTSKGNSMPSRHLACAGVIALCFFPYLPAVGALLSVLALGLGYTRFALGWHYPSDLFVGLAVGVCVGCGIFLF